MTRLMWMMAFATLGVLFLAAPAEAQTLSELDSFEHTCGSTATQFRSPVGQLAIRCEPQGGGVVYFGGASVTTANGYPVGSGHADPALTITARRAWCVAASDVQIRCIAGR